MLEVARDGMNRSEAPRSMFDRVEVVVVRRRLEEGVLLLLPVEYNELLAEDCGVLGKKNCLAAGDSFSEVMIGEGRNKLLES